MSGLKGLAEFVGEAVDVHGRVSMICSAGRVANLPQVETRPTRLRKTEELHLGDLNV